MKHAAKSFVLEHPYLTAFFVVPTVVWGTVGLVTAVRGTPAARRPVRMSGADDPSGGEAAPEPEAEPNTETEAAGVELGAVAASEVTLRRELLEATRAEAQIRAQLREIRSRGIAVPPHVVNVLEVRIQQLERRQDALRKMIDAHVRARS